MSGQHKGISEKSKLAQSLSQLWQEPIFNSLNINYWKQREYGFQPCKGRLVVVKCVQRTAK